MVRSLETVDAPGTIICVECGELAHLASHPRPDEDFEAGQSVVYLCSDCGLRLDVVLDADGDEEDDSSRAWQHPMG